MKRSILIILSFVVIFFIVCFCLNKNNKINNCIDVKNLNISINRIEECINNSITSREILIKENYILIGENKKELENDYYDIRIEVYEDKLIFKLNKLWKKFDEKLYEEEYINEMVDVICKLLDCEGKKEQVKICVINGYNESKKDNTSGFENNLKMKNYNLKGKISNKEYVICLLKE